MSIDKSKSNWYISTFSKNSKEYKQLCDFADRLNNSISGDVEYIVEDFLFDAGQNWMWTSILRVDKKEPSSTLRATWALYPAQQRDILEGRGELVFNKIIAKEEERSFEC